MQNKLELTNEFIKNFQLGSVYGSEAKEVANNILDTVEKLSQTKSQNEYQKLIGILKYYELPFESVVQFVKENLDDEYIKKFKELERETWYKIYDDISNSNIPDSEKIHYKKEVTNNLSKSNNQKEALGIAKFGIGLLGIIKAIATIGNTMNEMQDDQKTRRTKYKYKSK